MKRFHQVCWAIGIFFLSASATYAQPGQSKKESYKFSLKQCIDYGLHHHPSAVIYRYEVEKSNQKAKELLSQYLPQVNASAGLDYNIKLQQTIIPAGAFGEGSPEQRVAFGQKWNSSATIQADQQLYNQALITGLKANRPNKELAALTEEDNKQNIIYNISASYYRILIAKTQLGLLNSNKERFEKILKVTELQANQGVAKRVDIKQVQVNLNNVNSQISLTENNLRLAENTLKNNLGLPLNTDLELIDIDSWSTLEPRFEKPEFDYKNTLQYLKQVKQIEMLSINKQSISHEALPTIGLYGRYGALGFGAEIGKAYNPLLDFSAVGVKLSWPIFTGLRRSARYQQADLDLRIAQENLALNEQLSTLQHQNFSLQLNNATSNIVLNKQNVELAREVYDNTTLQYREGVASLSDLLNAELAYREAQNIYMNSLVDYYLADLDVQRNNGTLTEYYNNLK